MLINATISELDIEHASSSIWYASGKIDYDKYLELINYDKHTRVVKSGLMQKDDPSLTETLFNSYSIYIDKLKKANDIGDDQVLETVKDAVWLIDTIPINLEFGPIKFSIKGIYDIYYKYKNFSFYLENVTNNIRTRGVEKSLKDSKIIKFIREIMVDYINDDKSRLYDKLHKVRIKLEKDPESMGPNIVKTDITSNLKLIKHMIKDFT